MCRWIAYSGQPIFMDELVTKPTHSLVEQSMDTEMNFKDDGSLWATNGDGFGVGWYGKKKHEPGIFKGARPAWNDNNLHELCKQIEAYIFFAHIRASTTGAVQRTNSHPFKYKNWLFQHNGHVTDFPDIKRSLQFSLRPDLFKEIKGTTDSETFFFLTIHHGLEENPKAAIEETIRQLAKTQIDEGFPVSINLSCSFSDGNKIYTIRYAAGEKEVIKSQFYSTDMTCVQDLAVECDVLPEGGVVVVSEPLAHYCDKWIEAPENSFMTIKDGTVEIETLNV